MLPREHLNHCKKVKNLTICSSIILEFIEEPENCIKIYFNISNECEMRKIIPQNYFVDTSDFSMYCFVREPIDLRTSCAKEVKILNINKSQEIFYEKHCEMFKLINKTVLVTPSFTEIELESKYMRPNLSTFDSNTNDWTDIIQRINQYGNEYAELYEITEEIEDSREANENNMEDNSSNYWNRITNILDQISIFSIIKYIFCLLVVILVVKLVKQAFLMFKNAPTI